jgi:hypothetical protein
MFSQRAVLAAGALAKHNAAALRATPEAGSARATQHAGADSLSVCRTEAGAFLQLLVSPPEPAGLTNALRPFALCPVVEARSPGSGGGW